MKSINRGFWNDNPAEYFSVQRPEEFNAAIEAAKDDGSIDNWSWSQLLGKVPPPGYDWLGRKAEAE